MKKQILLISSDGGHLAQILSLKDFFVNHEYLIVTEKTPATELLSKELNVEFLKPRPKGRHRSLGFFLSILRNFITSYKIILKHRPVAIITTGSHTAIPACYIGKLLGSKIIWILTFARINSKAASASLVYPIADKFIVQWPSMLKHYKKAIYLGSIY